jgi:hypothetical protein
LSCGTFHSPPEEAYQESGLDKWLLFRQCVCYLLIQIKLWFRQLLLQIFIGLA